MNDMNDMNGAVTEPVEARSEKENEGFTRKETAKLVRFLVFVEGFLMPRALRSLTKQVSPTQLSLLIQLSVTDLIMSDLIVTGICNTSAAVTGQVDRMEKCGYVQRIKTEGDRRKVTIQITRKGLSLVERLRENLQEMLNEEFVAPATGIRVGPACMEIRNLSVVTS